MRPKEVSSGGKGSGTSRSTAPAADQHRKLRYTVEFLTPLYPRKRVCNSRRRWGGGKQDCLGLLHDGTVSRKIFAEPAAGLIRAT